jgi:hypothetical protein
MSFARALRGWRQMLVNQGPGPTARTAWSRLHDKIRPAAPAPAPSEEWQASDIHPFDQRFGLDTSGLIWGEHLRSGARNDAWNTAYYAIAPSVFHSVIGALPIDFPRFTFIDFGSGKGRAVMLAASYPFREILGIELSPELHAVAAANLARYHPPERLCQNVRLLNQDAAAFRFPPGPLALFFYHPFCRPVLERVLANLGRSLAQDPREAWVVYINPEVRAVLDRAPFLERVSESTLTMDAEDRLADRVGSSTETAAIYRATAGQPLTRS